jgi:hypothetical protein
MAGMGDWIKYAAWVHMSSSISHGFKTRVTFKFIIAGGSGVLRLHDGGNRQGYRLNIAYKPDIQYQWINVF